MKCAECSGKTEPKYSRPRTVRPVADLSGCFRLTAAGRRAGANSFADLDTDIQRVHDAAKGRAFNVRAQAKLMPR